MKTLSLLATLILFATGGAYASDGHIHDHSKDHAPAHGGIVTEIHHSDFELVAKPEGIQIYARDQGRPVDVSKGSAKLTLLSGKDKQEIQLKPMANRFEATGAFKVTAGTKAVALVSLPGKPAVTVRFVLK